MREGFDEIGSKRWSPISIRVTEAELRLDYLIEAYLSEHFPEIPIYNSGTSENTAEGWLWMYDSIDGSQQFTHGIPICCTSLALLHNGEVLAGCIYDPFLQRFYYAEQGAGATLNGEPVTTARPGSLSDSVVIISGGHGSLIDAGKLFNLLHDAGARPLFLASSLYAASLVASGAIAGAVIGSKLPFDAAASDVLTREAGGIVTNITGEKQSYCIPIHGAIVSSPTLYNQLLSLVRKSLLD